MMTRTWVCLHCKTCEVFETGEPVKICPNCTSSEITVYEGCHCSNCPVWKACLFGNKPLNKEELTEACKKILSYTREEKCQHE